MKKLNVTLEDGAEAVLTVDGMFVEGMHFDGMDEIRGIKEMRRASDVEFDSESQKWCAVIRRGFRHGFGPHECQMNKRSECIAWERRYLNREEIFKC